MPETMTKQKLLSHLLGALKKQYDPPTEPDRSVLDHLLYALLRENASRKGADRAKEAEKAVMEVPWLATVRSPFHAKEAWNLNI